MPCMINVLKKNQKFYFNISVKLLSTFFLPIFNCIKCSARHLSDHIVNLTHDVTLCVKIAYLACLVSYFEITMTSEKEF